MLQALLSRRAGIAGMLAIGTALAVSSIGIVQADTHRAHPDKTKNCNNGSYCQAYVNNGTGAGLEAVTNGQNARAFFVYGTNSGADGADISGGYIGIIGRAPAGSGLYPMVLTDSNGTDLDFTDTSGNLYYHGSLIAFAKTRGGARIVSYTPQTTTRTVEDVGSGRLVNGQGAVTLERTFAQSIDLSSAYHVFLTPNGDTRGLYVASKTPNGFVVRETQGGRGNLSFDYRVVATAAGHAGERMGQMLTLPNAQPRR